MLGEHGTSHLSALRLRGSRSPGIITGRRVGARHGRNSRSRTVAHGLESRDAAPAAGTAMEDARYVRKSVTAYAYLIKKAKLIGERLGVLS